MKLLSAIVPCYNEEENVPYFYEEFLKNESFFKENNLDFELWYIDDGSKDKTAEEVKKLIQKDSRVHLLTFSRNFGKDAAIFAGFEKAKGDYVACMDADLQDPPSLLPEMFENIWQGYDMVATRRVNRKGEPPIRSFFARMFYRLMNKISDAQIADGARDFRLMTRPAADAIVSMREYNRFTKGIFGWVGFKTKWLEFDNVERKKGETDKQTQPTKGVTKDNAKDHKSGPCARGRAGAARHPLFSRGGPDQPARRGGGRACVQRT